MIRTGQKNPKSVTLYPLGCDLIIGNMGTVFGNMLALDSSAYTGTGTRITNCKK